MIEHRLQSETFEAICREVFATGRAVRFEARGASMSPAIRDGDVVHVRPLREIPAAGDILLVRTRDGLRLHRLVRSDEGSDIYVTRGDCGIQDDAPVSGSDVLGIAESKETRWLGKSVQIGINTLAGRALQRLAKMRSAAGRLLSTKWAQLHGAHLPIVLGVLFLGVASLGVTQVAVDSTNSRAAKLTGPATGNITRNHTTAGTNRLLVVAVEMNITNAPASSVSSITYNGTALTLLGAHNDTAATRRVELWYLLAPAAGTLPISVNVNIPGAQTVGVAVGATTFTGVDQTVPLGAFNSADGAAGNNSQLDVPSVVNGMVLDALATGGPVTVTVPGPQVSQYNVVSAAFGAADPPDVTGVGTSRSGAPSVPIAETFNAASNWSLGAASINPTSADIGVSTTVNAVALGQSSTYNITVFNNGPSTANGVTLTDTPNLSASLVLNSITPSAGVTCTGTAPISCTIGTLGVGATATVAVKVTASAAGYYPNTATVTDSGTPPDSNTGNNTDVALAPVQNIFCSANTPPVGATLTGVLNTYYPGTATVAAGAKSIPVGAAAGGAGAIANGSLLLVVQMQDASISTSNTVAYGNGSTGSGFTAVNNAGNYEFVYATGAVSGGAVPITGAGTGGGLVFGYTSAAVTAAKGQSTYQVVLVPSYSSATLGSGLTASAWNGSTGGVLAIDVAGTLSLGGATVAVDGLGFRGGAGMQLSGGAGGANTDYLHVSPATYTGVSEKGVDAAKGEGIAGTPLWVESASTYLNTGKGYPSGTAGTDGSMARGAPGNAGGGGTDADPTSNDENAGGGGGSNGGGGGFGGNSWSTNLSTGGEGGSAFPATIDRLAMGGGGGAGSRNNSNGDALASSGSAGGGIIFIRAGVLSGTATLTANGSNSYIGTSNDAGGGGGAAGTIVVLSLNGGESGLTLQAQGGRGGDAWDSDPYSLGDRHGPGGGGGGGVVYVSGTPASVSITGGAMGTTLNPGVAYGATAGAAGTSATTATFQQVTGVQSGAACAPDMTLQKSHVGTFVRGSAASFTIPVKNVSLYGATSGVVTMNDTLPLGLTPASASGAGWTCSAASQTVSCVRSDVLAAGASYASITLNVNVAQTAPAVVTNIATIGGGNEDYLGNDTATDTAQVISTADLAAGIVDSPDPVAAGNNITYTISASDLGPSAADNATLVFPIPTNTTFASVTPPAGWSCASPAVGATGTVLCTTVTMAGGTAANFTLLVKVNTGTANGTVISGTASVSSGVTDPVPANNTATATTTVGTTAPNLTVTNVASPVPVQAGANIKYTQVVTNTGATAVTGATFTEATPANTAFVSITPPSGWSCAGFPPTCTDPSVAGGASGIFTVIYSVNGTATAGTVITDTATVNGTNQAFGASSATATDVVAGAAQADLALSTTATPLTVFAGNNITYTQTVTNNGPAAASSVSFSEVIPANTTFSSFSAPAGWTCTATTSVTCTNPSLAVGASVDIVVVLSVAPATAAGSITATSSVSSSTSDPTSGNNNTSVTTAVSVACDLTATNSGIPSPVAAGGTITYTQTVYNNGPSNCTTATFVEPTPANTAFASVAVVTAGGGTWTCPNAAPVSCTNPSVPPGSTATITAKYTVGGAVVAGTIIADTVTAGSASRDTNLADNTATVNIAVASGTQADLSVTNSASPNPVGAGSNITYTQTVTNNGPAAATAVVFNDPVPANTVVVSLAAPGWTCSIASTPPSCTIASLAASGTGNFTFVVTVNANAPAGTIPQTDSVSAATGDPNNANNSATTSVQVGASADLSVSDSASPVPAQAGNIITYSQVITNSGPSTATSVTLTETVPANTTAQTLTGPPGWTCNVGTLTCTISTLATGPTGTFSFTVKVNGGTAAGTAINDTVTVGSTVSDPNSANNTATASDIVATATQADLIVTNTPSSTSVTAGSNVTYTQVVTNNGPAVATAPTFNETVPPNETFQSITIPSGWSCTTPAVGSTGNISCTDGSSLALATPVTFTVVLGVNATTASGTYIPDTATASAGNLVPSLTSNSATATVLVGGATSADMSITKSGAPNPVAQGGTLSYTLTVKNSGPATATNVTATDVLPNSVTYLSATPPPGGTCSQAGGTVTCQLGTMASGASGNVVILTIAATPGVVLNTATVTASQTDPNLVNNVASQTETITYPTRIQLQDFQASRFKDSSGALRTLLSWRTSGEAQNLGFNVYRQDGAQPVRLNSSLIAGSALLMNGTLPKHGAKTYRWVDMTAAGSASYWLEDVDVSGARTMHGPISAASLSAGDAAALPSSLLNRLNLSQPVSASAQMRYNSEQMLHDFAPTPAQIQKQFELAAGPAVKLYLKHEGWYRVTQPELLKAGLDPNVDPGLLQLYAEAVQQPIEITGATAGPGGFGPQATISFYGTGMDTQYTGTRVYWLVAGQTQGLRIGHVAPSEGSNVPPANFRSSVELKPRTTYFAALLTRDGDNFFGPLISSTPLDQTLFLAHLEPNAAETARLDVTLRGVIVGNPHDVTIALNGVTVGDLAFTGQDEGRFHVDLPPSALQEGTNTVTLTAQDGQYDYSLVDTIRIAYPHKYAMDSGRLKFTGRAGEEVAVTGAGTGLAALLDITDPSAAVLLAPQVTRQDSAFAARFQVPWASTNDSSGARHTLLAIDEAQVSQPLGLRSNQPSHWHSKQPGANIAMVTAEELAPALKGLAKLHAREGKSSVVVSVTSVFDEFNFGERSPYAIRDFLQAAESNWTTPPSFLLLNGRASVDPRNYLGLGHLDLVPTKIVPTPSLMTASDDWFSDFTQTNMPTVATGRLPVSTPADADMVVSKVVSYAGTTTSGAWTGRALMVADRDDTEDFSQDSLNVQAAIPSSIVPTDIFAGTMDVTMARQQIVSAINSGQVLVNYIGHGSEDQWSGENLLDNDAAMSLTNGNSLPVFLILDCLNGFFQDVSDQSLGVTLMLAPKGGAAAVLASSGLNQPGPQFRLDRLVVQNLFQKDHSTMGEAVLKAKQQILDPVVRKTYILFGDPAITIKTPAATASAAATRP